MKNFLRALRQASKHWMAILLASACSFAVATLWAANIGAFLPILEVTIRGTSTQKWVEAEISRCDTALENIGTEISQIEQELAAPVVAVERQQSLSVTRDNLIRSRDIYLAQREGYAKTQPWLDRFVPHDPFNTIVLIVAALVGSTLLRHVFLIGNELLVGRVALDISRDLRNRIFKRVVFMDRASFARQGNATFVNLIVHTTEMLSVGLMNTLGAAVREPLKLIGCMIGAAMICWRLLLMSVVIAPVCGFMLYVVTRRIKGISNRVLERSAGFHEVLLESLENIQTIQAFQTEQMEQKRFDTATSLMKRFGLKFLFLTSLSKPIIEFLGVGMLGTTIIGGSYLVLNNQTHIMGMRICDEPLSVSALLVFFGFLIGLSDPLRKLSTVYATIYSGTVAADLIYTMLDRPSEIRDPENPKTLSSPHGRLRLNSVDFGYYAGQTVISDINLDIDFGSTIAIVGSNGSGKSTLINLLCRFYDPTAGTITLDGIDYRELRIADVRGRIALVNQQTELFNDTVTYNIRYGTPSATDEEVIAAAKRAHAHEFISTVLQDGYATRVGRNGSSLSGGQRQRIALARALLCNPEILILDEATSQIDMQSEQLIRESLAELRGERTMIIITHREKLLELADRVYEVAEGQLVERPHLARRAA
jgi:ATP-binding cassette, subfamily B, bacterial MsbA